jgi:hypothetical protein
MRSLLERIKRLLLGDRRAKARRPQRVAVKSPDIAALRRKVPAVVFGRLSDGELSLLVYPGHGLADGGTTHPVPIAMVPAELRTPNTRLWLSYSDNLQIERVWARGPDE